MRPRIKLHKILVDILGSEHVYYQPPSTIMMNYPCIVYKLEKIDIKHADNSSYLRDKRYFITVIDKKPDSLITDRVSRLPKCAFSNHMTVDNLNHDSFSIYF